MAPTPLLARALVVVAIAALVIPPGLSLIVALAVLAAGAVDAAAVRRPTVVTRRVPEVLSRGVPARLAIDAETDVGRLWVRQAAVPDVEIDLQEATGSFMATVVARRRGRHVLPPVGVRREGPLRLGRSHHTAGAPAEIHVYPNIHAAREIATAVRRGRFGDPGRLSRGPLGLGTDFESIRNYIPDDDIRQVNWRATARLGRPMSNQYRVERDRDVLCAVDSGRLMRAPVGDRTRLDEVLDATVAVAMVADVVGDRCGAVAFDSRVRTFVRPRHRGGGAVIHSLYDLEPTTSDSDYELAFRTVAGGKRTLIMVFTDILDEAAARSLVQAVPILARRHVVVVASVVDPELEDTITASPDSALDVYAQAVALDVVEARAAAARRLRNAGAQVLEARPSRLARACVRAYLAAKSRARL